MSKKRSATARFAKPSKCKLKPTAVDLDEVFWMWVRRPYGVEFLTSSRENPWMGHFPIDAPRTSTDAQLEALAAKEVAQLFPNRKLTRVANLDEARKRSEPIMKALLAMSEAEFLRQTQAEKPRKKPRYAAPPPAECNPPRGPGHYVLIQEPSQPAVYVRCADLDQGLDVATTELNGKRKGTRVTLLRKAPRETAELLATWRVDSSGKVRRYRINPSRP